MGKSLVSAHGLTAVYLNINVGQFADGSGCFGRSQIRMFIRYCWNATMFRRHTSDV